MNIWWILAGLAAALVLWGAVEQHLLLVRKKEIPMETLPDGWDALRILHMSDLHFRNRTKINMRLIERSKAFAPEIIVITGDLVSRKTDRYDHVASFIQKLRAICPVYLCMGNHESTLAQADRQRYVQAVTAAGGQFLDGRAEKWVRMPAELPLYLAGIELPISVYQSMTASQKKSYRRLSGYPLEQMRADLPKPDGFTILLAHNPLFLDTYAAWGADLVLSGHVHGGAVRLPFLGGLLSPERKFLPKYSKGCYQKGRTTLYVSGGVGKLRLFNPPEINGLILRIAKQPKQ